MLRRGPPVEYSYSIKDFFYVKACIIVFGGGKGDWPSQPLPLRGPCKAVPRTLKTSLFSETIFHLKHNTTQELSEVACKYIFVNRI